MFESMSDAQKTRQFVVEAQRHDSCISAAQDLSRQDTRIMAFHLELHQIDQLAAGHKGSEDELRAGELAMHVSPGVFVVGWLGVFLWQRHDLDGPLLSRLLVCAQLHNGKPCSNALALGQACKTHRQPRTLNSGTASASQHAISSDQVALGFLGLWR